MGLCLSQTTLCSQRILCDDSFASVFTRTEALMESAEYKEAIEFAGRRKNSEKYRSIMDFLVCETFTFFRWRCFEYYNNDGIKLKEIVSSDNIKKYDDYMCDVILPEALRFFKRGSKFSWRKLMEFCEDNFKHPARWGCLY